MEKKLKRNIHIHIYIYVKLNHCAVHLKLTQHCKSTMLLQKVVYFRRKKKGAERSFARISLRLWHCYNMQQKTLELSSKRNAFILEHDFLTFYIFFSFFHITISSKLNANVQRNETLALQIYTHQIRKRESYSPLADCKSPDF